MKLHAMSVVAAAVLLAGCSVGEDGAEAPAPAYMPETVRQARAQAAEQAERLKALAQASAWRVLDISGQAFAAETPASLVFSDGATVSGSAGCNTFNGAVSLAEAQLRFGPLATTRKLCPEPVMAQERRLLDTLANVISAGVDEDGRLFLSTLDGDTIRLVQEPPEAN